MKPFLTPYPWTAYSNRLVERILNPRNVGFFKENSESMQEMRVVIGEAFDQESHVFLFLVVDETDGVIADVKFQAFGKSALIGAADVICEIVLRKNYHQASRVTAELVDKKLRDFDDVQAFPDLSSDQLNLVIEALALACEKCIDISISLPDYVSPIPNQFDAKETFFEWDVLTKEEKLALICNVIQQEIQPYIALDAGGIEVQSFEKDFEVVIAYRGACTTCPSSTGATLNAIQEILRARIHPSLVVKPDLSLLNPALRTT